VNDLPRAFGADFLSSLLFFVSDGWTASESELSRRLVSVLGLRPFLVISGTAAGSSLSLDSTACLCRLLDGMDNVERKMNVFDGMLNECRVKVEIG
jgi:hypothetical protein